MANLLTSDTKDPDLTCDDAYRLFLITRRELLVDYRFGRTQVKRDRFRGGRSFRGVKGLLKNMIEAIANAKMHRMERELELRGYDRSNDDWVSRNPGRAVFRKD
jgi:hypothetical protein